MDSWEAALALTNLAEPENAEHTERWYKNFVVLQKYVETKGRIPSTRTVYKGRNIGTWVHTQRRRWKMKLLKQNYIDMLETIPGWLWDASETTNSNTPAKWAAVLRKYIEIYGDLPKSRIEWEYENQIWKLGNWVTRMRYKYRNDMLSAAAIDELDSIPEWSWWP